MEAIRTDIYVTNVEANRGIALNCVPFFNAAKKEKEGKSPKPSPKPGKKESTKKTGKDHSTKSSLGNDLPHTSTEKEPNHKTVVVGGFKTEVLGTADERDVLFQPGRLIVDLIAARDLCDRAKSPYGLASYEHNQILLPVHSGKNPVWAAQAVFDIVNSNYQLTIHILEKAETQNNFLGMLHILPSWVPNQPYENWYNLQGDGEMEVSGQAHVRVTFKKADTRKLTVDDFDLLMVIGKGSFGKVLQVKKKDTNRIYAMKILKKGHLIERDELEHTKSERAILAKNNNCPFLVGLKFSFQTPEKLYLVLDYINGGELFFHLQNEGTFSENRSRFYASQLVLGLKYLHENDIIYRDLKPENILIDFMGYICLTDFGLCKENIKWDDITNTFCGTPEYMAPEVLQQKGYGPAVDWWTIGVLLYEMITGLPPFYDENTNQMYQKILFADLKFPQGVSREATSIIKQLLVRNPQNRLGYGATGSQDIVDHEFFAVINWDDMWNKRLVAPWRPHLEDQLDTKNFDEEFTALPAQDTLVTEAPITNTMQAEFKGFTYSDTNEYLEN
ncbi:AGC/AKT protein kinase [Sphaeroforma arctica JP610]|uniref:non-specific serine/threonine protein kinase n=1 Tax=Sphaeroforma arctica JP610 TaxID=667725 RepID=A0A0L0G4P2_9EUKA|nr:AGC/AKT protein kinase [Sphaeroforma arctica JP610]KNC84042.1 AGC/AKT protein kinase [Sphaeroforma arctica JP610]|eukprot:XP_014157944.1 AGC/AKT protein kinase [Sphaeroforma arctica JP610]